MANENDPFADIRRKIEETLGYPPGAFDPASDFLRDMERINKVLGLGFVRLQDVIGPQQLLDRIEASLDFPARREVLDLPRRMFEIPPPFLDGVWKKRD